MRQNKSQIGQALRTVDREIQESTDAQLGASNVVVCRFAVDREQAAQGDNVALAVIVISDDEPAVTAEILEAIKAATDGIYTRRIDAAAAADHFED